MAGISRWRWIIKPSAAHHCGRQRHVRLTGLWTDNPGVAWYCTSPRQGAAAHENRRREEHLQPASSKRTIKDLWLAKVGLLVRGRERGEWGWTTFPEWKAISLPDVTITTGPKGLQGCVTKSFLGMQVVEVQLVYLQRNTNPRQRKKGANMERIPEQMTT